MSLTIREVGARELFRALQHLLLDGLRLPARPLDDAALQTAGEQLLRRFRQRLPDLSAADLLAFARDAQRAEGDVPGLGASPGIAALAERLAAGASE